VTFTAAHDGGGVRLTSTVERALAAGRPVVALESSVFVQGLPAPYNRQAAERVIHAVEAVGAIPAITAVVRGVPTAGLEPDELERLLESGDSVTKVSARDVPWAMARGLDGATTVAGSLLLAARAGICVFATGGIGGVHRAPPFDESADLAELARSPLVVVCAGAKSILDLRATVERLETLGVLVAGYGTSELPGFFTVETGIPLSARVDTADEAARVFAAQRAIRRPGALVIAQPPPSDVALSVAEVDSAVERAEERWRQSGVRGRDLTPFLLNAVREETGGRSLEVNVALLERNASLAAEIAVCLAKPTSVPRTGRGASERKGPPR
jgi:pseudouridine-5'-phosphate glycosidase